MRSHVRRREYAARPDRTGSLCGVRRSAVRRSRRRPCGTYTRGGRRTAQLVAKTLHLRLCLAGAVQLVAEQGASLQQFVHSCLQCCHACLLDPAAAPAETRAGRASWRSASGPSRTVEIVIELLELADPRGCAIGVRPGEPKLLL